MSAREPVYCEGCESCVKRLVNESRDLPAWRWMCLAFPVEEPPQFVTRSFRLTEPYRRCSTVNPDGDCELYEPRREEPA